jgi:hypothetical protein
VVGWLIVKQKETTAYIIINVDDKRQRRQALFYPCKTGVHAAAAPFPLSLNITVLSSLERFTR